MRCCIYMLAQAPLYSVEPLPCPPRSLMPRQRCCALSWRQRGRCASSPSGVRAAQPSRSSCPRWRCCARHWRRSGPGTCASSRPTSPLLLPRRLAGGGSCMLRQGLWWRLQRLGQRVYLICTVIGAACVIYRVFQYAPASVQLLAQAGWAATQLACRLDPPPSAGHPALQQELTGVLRCSCLGVTSLFRVLVGGLPCLGLPCLHNPLFSKRAAGQQLAVPASPLTTRSLIKLNALAHQAIIAAAAAACPRSLPNTIHTTTLPLAGWVGDAPPQQP